MSEALRLSRAAWIELSITGSCKSEVKTIDLHRFTHSCPLCEEHFDTDRYRHARCESCPVQWTEDPNEEEYSCCVFDSPYFQWETSREFEEIENKKYWASKVLYLIEQAMERAGMDLGVM